MRGFHYSNLPLIAGAAAVAAATVYMYRKIVGDVRFDQDRSRLVMLGMYCCGALMWPVVLASFAPEAVPKNSAQMLAHAFPVLYLLVNANLAPERRRMASRRFEDVKSGGLMLTGVIFTASMLMGGCAADGSGVNKTSRTLLKMALLGSVLLVMPTPDVDRSTYAGVMLTSLQNVLLSYGLGLFAVAATQS